MTSPALLLICYLVGAAPGGIEHAEGTVNDSISVVWDWNDDDERYEQTSHPGAFIEAGADGRWYYSEPSLGDPALIDLPTDSHPFWSGQAIYSWSSFAGGVGFSEGLPEGWELGGDGYGDAATWNGTSWAHATPGSLLRDFGVNFPGTVDALRDAITGSLGVLIVKLLIPWIFIIFFLRTMQLMVGVPPSQDAKDLARWIKKGGKRPAAARYFGLDEDEQKDVLNSKIESGRQLDRHDLAMLRVFRRQRRERLKKKVGEFITNQGREVLKYQGRKRRRKAA